LSSIKLQTSNLKTSLYYIAIIIPEPLQSEITALKTAIHQRFGAKIALKSPAHITLFPPFRWEITNEKALKTAIDAFAFSFFEKRGPPEEESGQAIRINLKNFGFFRKSTVFIQPETNESLSILRGSLLDYLSMHINLRDEKDAARPFHPHITLVNRDISETDFDLIWGEYARKTFEADFSVDTISLLRKGEERWEIVT
jgi:2'-5' RNA ligase